MSWPERVLLTLLAALLALAGAWFATGGWAVLVALAMG